MPDCPLGHGAPRRPRRARGARRARRGRLAEDLGRQGAARLRPHRAGATASATSAAPRWPSPARSSAGRPDDVTTTWWRKDRDPAALFVDYNQNARDHTMAAAYSVRGVPDGHGVDADHVGRGRRRRARRLHDGDGARAASPSSATSTPASTTPCSPSTSCSSGPTATSGPAPSTPASPTTRTDRAGRQRRPGRRFGPADSLTVVVPSPISAVISASAMAART